MNGSAASRSDAGRPSATAAFFWLLPRTSAVLPKLLSGREHHWRFMHPSMFLTSAAHNPCGVSLIPRLLKPRTRPSGGVILRIQKATTFPVPCGATVSSACPGAFYPSQRRPFLQPSTRPPLHFTPSTTATFSTMSSATTFYDFEPVDSTSFPYSFPRDNKRPN